MSATYYGTFPVKTIVSSFVDQNRIRYSTQKIICTSTGYSNSMPAIGSAYEPDSNLAVTDARTRFIENGLVEIDVTAAGPSEDVQPRIRLLPGAPFIYGLGTQSQRDPRFTIPKFSATGGLCVNVSFITTAGSENEVVSTYAQKVMPGSIQGVDLPDAPPPGSMSSNPQQGGTGQSYFGSYYGFWCQEISTETFGAALLVNLYFKEKGFLFQGNTKIFEF